MIATVISIYLTKERNSYDLNENSFDWNNMKMMSIVVCCGIIKMSKAPCLFIEIARRKARENLQSRENKFVILECLECTFARGEMSRRKVK